MNPIPEFSPNELWIIHDTLKQRFEQEIAVELAESEIRLNPLSSELSLCPVAYWEALGANFIVAKVAEGRYRCQFFYRVHEQFGTGIEEYDDLTECIVTLLQVHADHEQQRQQAK